MMHPMGLKNLSIVVFCDSSFGPKPVECQMLLFCRPEFLESESTEVNLMDWRAHRIPQAVGSTLSAETAAVRSGLGQGVWCRKLLLDILCKDWNPLNSDSYPDPFAISGTAVTDCASLYDHVQISTKQPRDERVRIPLLVVRDDLQEERTTLRWSPTGAMIADCGTKAESPLRDAVLQVMSGRWKWESPKDVQDDKDYGDCLATGMELEEAECNMMEIYSTTRRWNVVLPSLTGLLTYVVNAGTAKKKDYIYVKNRKTETKVYPMANFTTTKTEDPSEFKGVLMGTIAGGMIDWEPGHEWAEFWGDKIYDGWCEADSWIAKFEYLIHFFVRWLPMMAAHKLWCLADWWRGYHEHLMCVVETTSLLSAIYVFIMNYKRRKRVIPTELRVKIGATRCRASDVQTDTTWRRRDANGSDLVPHRYYYGHSSSSSDGEYYLVKPFIAKVSLNAVETHAVNYYAAAHPQNNPVEWKELMRYWKINQTTLVLNQAPISVLPTLKHENCQTKTEMISKLEAKLVAEEYARDYALKNRATVLETSCTNCNDKEAELCKDCHPGVPQFDARQAMLYPNRPAAAAPAAPASSSGGTTYEGHGLNFGSAYSANSATSYPFCWDGRRLTFGRNKGNHFWDVTAEDPGYCTWILQEVNEKGRMCSPAMRECQKYLVDRGFPFVSAPTR